MKLFGFRVEAVCLLALFITAVAGDTVVKAKISGLPVGEPGGSTTTTILGAMVANSNLGSVAQIS